MIDQQQKSNEACEFGEKPLYLKRDKIISYLSLLEKLYEKENKDSDKTDQKRLFLINKALNSVKKYSNLKVSPFKLGKLSVNKEEQKVQDNQDKCDLVVEKDNEESDINDIMCLIEKELKLNGIDVNDINDNSFMSTNLKSLNSDSSKGTENKKSNDGNTKNVDSNPLSPDELKEKPKNRLSKLFLKIELKLKTYLQEEQEKEQKLKLILDKEKALKTGDKLNILKGLNKNFNISNNDNNNKLSKKICKMPDLANSFFSNKKNVETMLSIAKKQKRKSMMEFNAFHLLKAKEDQGIYMEIDNSKDKNLKKRLATALLKRPKKEKMERNIGQDMISNFCGKIEEIAENKEEYEDIVPFDEVENKNPPNKEDDIHRGSITNPTPIFIDNNISSIKITSTINRNKLEINKLNKEIDKKISFCQNDPVRSTKINEFFDHSFLDDDLLVKSSSEKEATTGSKSGDEENSNVSSKDSSKKEDSKSSSEDKKEDENNTSENDKNMATNFNYFYRNSLFSPLSEHKEKKGLDNELCEKLNDMHL